MANRKSNSGKEVNVNHQQTTNQEDSLVTKTIIEVRTYHNDSTLIGWGYDIYADKVLYIHQPHIPAVSGNKGFDTKQKAEIAGNFAAYKIRNNIIPPTISLKELDSLGVLK